MSVYYWLDGDWKYECNYDEESIELFRIEESDED